MLIKTLSIVILCVLFPINIIIEAPMLKRCRECRLVPTYHRYPPLLQNTHTIQKRFFVFQNFMGEVVS